MNNKNYIRKFIVNDSDFAERLIKARKDANISKAELSRRLGVDKSMITKYENGTRYPVDENIYKISKILDVNPNILKYGHNTVCFDIGDGMLISHYHKNHDPSKKGIMFSTDPLEHFFHSEKECLEEIDNSIEYLKRNKDFESLSSLAEIAAKLESHSKITKAITKKTKKNK